MTLKPLWLQVVDNLESQTTPYGSIVKVDGNKRLWMSLACLNVSQLEASKWGSSKMLDPTWQFRCFSELYSSKLTGHLWFNVGLPSYGLCSHKLA